MVGQRTLTPYVEVRVLRPQPKSIPPGGVMRLELARKGYVTPVTWAFAPDMSTLEEACTLSGYDRGFMLQVIEADGVGLDDAGRIEKKSLWEWLEVSAEFAHWVD
jgi:hypothetical protein